MQTVRDDENEAVEAAAEPAAESTDKPDEQPPAEAEVGISEQTVFQPGGFVPGPFAQNTFSVPDPYQSGGAHPVANGPEQQPWPGQPGQYPTGEQPYPGAPPQHPGQEPQAGFEQPQFPGQQFPGQEQPQFPGQEPVAPQGPQSEPIYSWAPPPPLMYQPPMQGGMPPGPPPGEFGQPGQMPSGEFGQPGQMPGQPQPGEFGQPGQPQPGEFGGQPMQPQGQFPGGAPMGAPGQQWGAPQQQPFQPQHMTQPGQPGHSVNDLNLLKRARKSPRSGWRKAVHKVSGGVINPGESAADVVHRDLVERVNQPVRGDYRIAILSLKGGVGKTTTTVGLGSTFASQRGDRVIAIDANPDLGTLAHRVPRQTRSTVRNLLEDQSITRYSDVRAHTSQAPSRLEVLASEQDPAVSEAFSEADYRKAIGILQSFYNIILTDCGTGLMHSAMAGVLDMASSLVLVTSPAIDGARSASATLDWLDHHGYSKLVERTVVVVNASRRGASTVDLDQLRKLFLDRTRAVQVVPFDDHLAEGAEIDLELVSKPTRRALLELAAMVADDFGYHGQQQFQPGMQAQFQTGQFQPGQYQHGQF
ncbi:MinD/ParA family ATP-binding protein [Nocardia rosealba]|uniref:MinD/ParA family ATP-binding protein n=1 Tax=Nocardia rosealba TaxID=2878563 RepID=UPI001CD98B5A|nr:AAA family ATPase [Nocardia rosealba]MCA2209167.1 AAA family ATPase [Nocardia rosealba]